jgi:hypothetical protein
MTSSVLAQGGVSYDSLSKTLKAQFLVYTEALNLALEDENNVEVPDGLFTDELKLRITSAIKDIKNSKDTGVILYLVELAWAL